MVLITVLYVRIGVALRRSTIATGGGGGGYHQPRHYQQQQQQPVAEATTSAGARTACPGRVARVAPARVAQSRKSIFKMLGE